MHAVDTVLQEDPGYILWLSEQDWCDVSKEIVEMAQEYDFEEEHPEYNNGPAHNWSAYYGDDEPF